jgi:hypothetical protein
MEKIQPKKTCFVIIGYGPKTDYQTGRELDLDKTFEYIIKPAFEELEYLCYRASDLSHSGVIDLPMYDSILKADFVLADLSTLNPNVLYELGIRHAVRKNTTIIISEHALTYPFDLSHILIEKYEHLGKAIDYGEVMRFKDLLQKKIRHLEENPAVDSPLYTIFPDLEIPRFSVKEIKAIQENIKEDGSLSDIMTAAESARKASDFKEAIRLLHLARALNQDNTFVTQRLVVAIYKSELPTKHDALYAALEILETLNPMSTTDIETLGLSGAIHKRLFEIEGKVEHLNDALWFYEKGFYINNDYYNGINLAFLFTVSASLAEDKTESIVNFGNAKRIRLRVEKICNSYVESKGWESRDDKAWILLTLAEIAFSNGDLEKEQLFIEKVKAMGDSDFAIGSYNEQREKLSNLLALYQQKS